MAQITTDSVAQAVAALGDDPRLTALLNSMCELTGMGFAAVAYVSDTRWIACQVDDRINFGLNPGQELEVRKTICDEIRHCGRPVMIEDATNDPDWWSHPVPILYGFKSYVSVPLFLDDGSFFGTLCAIDPDPRASPISERLAEIQTLAKLAVELLVERLADARLRDAIPLTPSVKAP